MAIDIPEIMLHAAAPGPMYLATVVKTEGPCYRKVGARLLVGSLGRLAGAVSGGCVERALVRRSEWLAEEGARVETYDTAADGDETELSYLGCGGVIDVLVQRAEPALFRMLERVAARDATACIATVIASSAPTVSLGDAWAWVDGPDDDIPAWAAACQSLVNECLSDGSHRVRVVPTAAGEVSVLVEFVPPARHLLIAARHYDAAPMIRVAREAGWQVTLATGADADDLGAADHRIGLSHRELTEWCDRHRSGAAVIMTHSVALDRQCLAAALQAGAPAYLAVLGPKRRTADLLEALDEAGELPVGAAASVKTPAGLDLGGEGAAAIAISVVAELERSFARRIPVR